MKLNNIQLKKLHDVYVSKPSLKHILHMSFKDWLSSYKDTPHILLSMIK